MNINVNNPLSREQLAALYSGDARARDSEMFLGSSQAHGFVQQQARNMGISDPAAYFATLQNQRAMAAAPSLGQQLAAREMGQFAPNSLPAQLQRRDSMWDGVANGQAAQQAQIATLQRAQALQQTPLPTSNTPDFTAGSFGAHTGMSPQQYGLTKRLGGVNEGRQFVGSGQVDIDALSRDPRFRSLLESDPAKAQHVFSALTGGDFGVHEKARLARDADRNRFELDTVQDWAKSGRIRYDDKGNKITMRKLVEDPSNPGKMIVGSDYEEPDAFAAELLNRRYSEVAPLIAERMAIQSRLNAQASQVPQAPQHTAIPQQTSSVNPLNPDGNVTRKTFDMMYAAPRAFAENVAPLSVFAAPESLTRDTLMGAGKTVANAYLGARNFVGTQADELAGGALGYTPVAPYSNMAPMSAPEDTRQRALAVINTPRFQQLLKENPEAARRIIAQIHAVR